MPPAKACPAPAFPARATTPSAQHREWVAPLLVDPAPELPVKEAVTVVANKVVFLSSNAVVAVAAPEALVAQVVPQEARVRAVPVEAVPVEAAVAVVPVVVPRVHLEKVVRVARRGSQSARSVKNLKCRKLPSLAA